MLKTKENILQDINKVTQHIVKLGYKVDIVDKPIDNCDPNRKIITICYKSSPLITLYTLLHETAHAEIFESKSFNSTFGQIAIDIENRRSTNRGHYQKLKEEMVAWETGLNLAKKLKISIDTEHYESYAARCYLAYVNIAAKAYFNNKLKKQNVKFKFI
jgi:hypothetical protein